MNPALFTKESPGIVLKIPKDPRTGNQHAFLPSPLPPVWDFSANLWPLLAEAKYQVGILEGLGRNLPNPGILLRPLEDREAIQSSRLEGTYVTATELLVYAMQPKKSDWEESDALNAQREVFNYRKALQQGVISDLPLSLRLIRELHETLMAGVRGKDRTPGEFRKSQVALGTDHRFVPPPPEKMPECLHLLEKYFHAENASYEPLVDSFLIHYQFEAIHPFTDGNGRVGRLLLAIMLQRRCGLTKPWLHLSEYFEKHREEYIQRLFEISTLKHWEEWIRFCLTGIVTQAKDTIQRCDRLQAIKEAFTEKLREVGGSVRLNEIVRSIFYTPFVRISDLQKKLEVTYPTAKSDVDRLVKAGILSELNGINPKTYYAPAVFNVAYDAME